VLLSGGVVTVLGHLGASRPLGGGRAPPRITGCFRLQGRNPDPEVSSLQTDYSL